MTARPEFSPKMLRLFLHLRADFAVAEDPDARRDPRLAKRIIKRFRAAMRERAGVSVAEFAKAWGAAPSLEPEPRTRLWRAMDLDPADAGIRLTESGGQERIEP